MKKSPDAPTSSSIALQLQALEETCGYGDPLPNDVRELRQKLLRRVPAAIIDRIIAIALRENGVVAGIKFDPAAAKAALAEADDAEQVALAAQMLTRRALDHAVRLRAAVAGDASGIRSAMRGYVKTAQGASLVQESDELRAITRQHKGQVTASNTRAENQVKAVVAKATRSD